MDIKPDFNKAGSGDLLDPPTKQPVNGQGQPSNPGGANPPAASPEAKKEQGSESSPKTPQVDVYREMQSRLDRERATREKLEREKEDLSKKLESVGNLSEVENKLEEIKRKEAEFSAKETRAKLIREEFPHLTGNDDLVPLSDIDSMRQTASRLSGLGGNTSASASAPNFGASSGNRDSILKQFEGVASYEEARVKMNELGEEEFNRLSKEMGYGQGRENTLSDYERNLRNSKK